jgi:hypothetical protein
MKIFSAFAAVLAGSASLYSVAAAAESTTCTDSYEKAQEEKVAGHLNAALVHLKNCIAPSCPKFVRDDCVRWMDQTESALPTVVFAVRREGKDLTDVQVSCDGKPLLSSLDGKAVPVDPGLHDFRFNVPGRDPVQRQTIVREGERNRIIEVEFGSPRQVDVSPKSTADADAGLLAKPGERGVVARYLPYGMAGLAALGAAGFALFAIEGSNQKGELERSCSPYCRASQVDDVKTKYVLADTCLAVGIVSAGVATYLFLTRHGEKTERHDQTTSVGFAPRTSGVGGVLQVSSPF